jgi:hypothetical protein
MTVSRSHSSGTRVLLSQASDVERVQVYDTYLMGRVPARAGLNSSAHSSWLADRASGARSRTPCRPARRRDRGDGRVSFAG